MGRSPKTGRDLEGEGHKRGASWLRKAYSYIGMGDAVSGDDQ